MSYRFRLVDDYGTDPSVRQRAIPLRDKVLQTIHAGAPYVILDFDGIESISGSFADELIAVVVFRLGADWFREHVRIENLKADVRRTILEAVVERDQRGRRQKEAAESHDYLSV